ncbi:MAG: ankyrin repeat domain-containing protein [bacterium]
MNNFGKILTELIESISRGEVSLLSSFLDKGGHPDFGLDQDQSLLGKAVYHHNVEATALLLLHKAKCWDRLEYSDHNVLASAAFNGYPDIVKMLLEHGMPVDAHWRIRTTALHEACMMRCGADCPAWDYDDEVGSPAETARFVETASILVQAGADVNAVCEDWPGPDVEYTPLHFAVEAECLELVAFLIANDADKGATSSEGRTALDLARERNASNIIEFLEALDANV